MRREHTGRDSRAAARTTSPSPAAASPLLNIKQSIDGQTQEKSRQADGATVVPGVAAELSEDGEQLASPREQLLVGLGAAADGTGVLVLPGAGVP
ncbi:hypothetical protein [Mycobacterium kansasii]|uniref:hypothetical protein n=1 Tax=Mycobacterium kansasii TaxID=1768 RepID=UPI00287B957D|nr:hypothetical protein [Mycobacterium kansasii]